MTDLINVQHLSKTFTSTNETLNILKDINLSVANGERISITGESGSGKSTLLHLIGGLDNASSGNISINGIDITNMNETELSGFRNKTIGFIFQSHYLLEEFNALENVMIPFLMHTYNKKEAKNRAEYFLNEVGMNHRLKHHPSKMSGGERQRVAIARALMNDPILILADEPTGNLDAANADKAVNMLFNITDKMRHTLVIVTHSLLIAQMATKHYHLVDGNLKIQQ